MPNLPRRLAKDPILDATFEFRFEGKGEAAADLLQAQVYPRFKDQYPKVQRNPLSAFSAAFAQDPTLRYQPRTLLRGEHGSISIGDNSLAFTNTRPYLGWNAAKPLILQLLDCVKNADVVAKAERISLRYNNLLEAKNIEDQFKLVNFTSTLGRSKLPLNKLLTYTRTEIKEGDVVSIVELGANSEIAFPDGKKALGLILSVDTILKATPELLADPEPQLERVHTAEKSVFFDVLTDAAIQSMEPEW